MYKGLSTTKNTLKRISGFSTPIFGLSWTPNVPSATDGIHRRVDLVASILEQYAHVESEVWQAKEHFTKNRLLSKNEAVSYLRSTTTEAREIRARIRARRFELGNFQSIFDSISLLFLLCFAQLLALAMSDDKDIVGADEDMPNLEDNITNIGNQLQSLSVALGIYQKVLEEGEDCLDDNELSFFRWLSGRRTKLKQSWGQTSKAELRTDSTLFREVRRKEKRQQSKV